MISFNRVHKFYGRTHAVRDVSFEVSAGELVFVVGPSGSGKTTLLKMLTRELRADSGSVTVAGVEVGGLAASRVPALRRVVASVPQDHRLLPNRTVAGNLQFALVVQGWRRRAAKDRAAEILETVGLGGYGRRMPHELSGGERQRAAIARAVAGGPAVLVADEPTGNLDPETASAIGALFARIAAAGTTLVVATHDDALVDAAGCRVVAIRDGRIVADGAGRYRDALAARILAGAS